LQEPKMVSSTAGDAMMKVRLDKETFLVNMIESRRLKQRND